MGGKLKLPKITLPHFKGNPIHWTAYCDFFESAGAYLFVNYHFIQFIKLQSMNPNSVQLNNAMVN